MLIIAATINNSSSTGKFFIIYFNKQNFGLSFNKMAQDSQMDFKVLKLLVAQIKM